ncbi:MAG TPA: DNA-binding response regulator, partial [Mycobacterium sp.]
MRKTLTVANGATAAEAFERRAWTEVHAYLTDASEPLGADDNERLAIAAYLLGRDDESAHAWERAYRGFVADDNPDPAARCGFWLALTQLLAGNSAVGGGWLGRLGRLVEGVGSDC